MARKYRQYLQRLTFPDKDLLMEILDEPWVCRSLIRDLFYPELANVLLVESREKLVCIF